MSDAIVVGTDGSPSAQAAVVHAGRLAAAYGSHVHVVAAYGPPAVTSMTPEAVAHGGDGRERAAAALESARRALEAAGVAHDERAVPGGAADALCEVAAIEQAGTIVVGSRGMRGAGRMLGSVPNRVSHRAPCSVLIVRTD